MCARPAALTRPARRRGDVLAAQHDLALVWAAQPGDGFFQLGLPVAGHPGDAQDLAAAHLEAHPAQRGQAAVVVGVQVLDARRGSAGCAGPFAHQQDTSRPTIMRARSCSSVPAGRHRADHMAIAQHGDAVAGGQHLAQLVRDEDDRFAFAGQAAQDVQQIAPLPAVSARPSARPGSAPQRRGRAPSGSRRAAVRPPRASRLRRAGSIARPYLVGQRLEAPVHTSDVSLQEAVRGATAAQGRCSRPR